MKTKIIPPTLLAIVFVCLLIQQALAGIVHVEDFSVNDGGWSDRDPSDGMSVTRDVANSWLVASFGAQGFDFFEEGGLRIDTGNNFIGNYVTLGITQISFDFFAADVLPSYLYLMLLSGPEALIYAFNPLAGPQTYTVDLLFSFGWQADSESAFNTAIRNIDAVEIVIARSGTGYQEYYIDNITTYDTPLDETVGGEVVIPEPQTISLVLLAMTFLMMIRRKEKWRLAMAGLTPETTTGKPGGLVLLSLCMLTTAVHAAEPSIALLADAQGDTRWTAGSWALQEGDATLTFNSTPYALPDAGILSIATTATPLLGDYDEAGIAVIGFSFNAPDSLPAGNVILAWSGAGHTFQRGFSVTETGRWYHFTAPLGPDDAANWIPLTGTRDDYAMARRSVNEISLRINRTGTTARQYVVRDLFIARSPYGTTLAPVADNLLALQARDLLAGKSYIVETAESLHGPWQMSQTIQATNQTQWINIEANAPALFLRFIFP